MTENNMQDRIDTLSGHYIVCGAGRTGYHVISKLSDAAASFVVLEMNEERLEQCRHDFNPEMLSIPGDATDEKLIERAGISRAKGVFACLANDKDNLYLTFLVRRRAEEENPSLRIVSRAIDTSLIAMIRDAGANSVISPNLIGGMRMVSEMIRPVTTCLLDQLMQQRSDMEISEITLSNNSPMNNKTLGEFDPDQEWDVKIIAVKRPGETHYDYKPSPDKRVTAGSKISLMGDRADLANARILLAPKDD